MGLYSASKHAVEGLSKSLDHAVRHFGVRVVLVEPTYTRTGLDVNAPRAIARILDYVPERDRLERGFTQRVNSKPTPEHAAHTILKTALCRWTMRRLPTGQAALMSKLRRFMPFGPVDSALIKAFDLA